MTRPDWLDMNPNYLTRPDWLEMDPYDDLYEDEDEAYLARQEALNDRVYATLKEAGVAPPYFVYYCGGADSSRPDTPQDNLEAVPIRGAVQFVEEHDAFWGDGEDFTSPVLESPTWLEIAVQAEAQSRTTGDHHHIFLQGVYETEKRGGITIAGLSLGS